MKVYGGREISDEELMEILDDKTNQDIYLIKRIGEKYGYDYVIEICRELWIRKLIQLGNRDEVATYFVNKGINVNAMCYRSSRFKDIVTSAIASKNKRL